jgi:hypothetical protein
MNRISYVLAALSLCATVGFDVHATESGEDAVANGTVSPSQASSAVVSPEVAGMCFISGAPPSDVPYVPIGNMKLGKETYGGVKDILDEFAINAHALGADAIINYSGSQRFGFWPWRLVRPVVRGTAVKWSGTEKPDCKRAGGSTLEEIVASNKAPNKK